MMTYFRTNNPVLDAQRYMDMLEEMEENRSFIECDVCGQKIFREDANFDGDEYYEIAEYTVCEDCIQDYLDLYCKRQA